MKALKPVTLRNRVTKHQDTQNIDWEFHLKNLYGGCAGFITNKTDNKTIYVDTRPSPYGPSTSKIMFRNAFDIYDHVGGRNRWVDCKDNTFINGLVELATNVTCLDLQD